MRSIVIKRYLWSLPLLSLLVLTWLSHQDGTETVSQSYVILDKLKVFDIHLEYLVFRDMMHLVAFAGVGFTVYTALNHLRPPRLKHLVQSLVLIPIIALTDEYHQSFIPGRTPSVADFKLDVIGGTIGIGIGVIICISLYRIIHKMKEKNKPVPSS